MTYSWEEVKRAVERVEDAHLERRLADAEIPNAQNSRSFYVIRRMRPLLEALGGVAVGLHVAVMTLIFNYILFVWLLHINFDF